LGEPSITTEKKTRIWGRILLYAMVKANKSFARDGARNTSFSSEI
ncbi:unnamed protein product, partial [Brassica oleracea]